MAEKKRAAVTRPTFILDKERDAELIRFLSDAPSTLYQSQAVAELARQGMQQLGTSVGIPPAIAPAQAVEMRTTIHLDDSDLLNAYKAAPPGFRSLRLGQFIVAGYALQRGGLAAPVSAAVSPPVRDTVPPRSPAAPAKEATRGPVVQPPVSAQPPSPPPQPSPPRAEGTEPSMDDELDAHRYQERTMGQGQKLLRSLP
ncbi:hypothetical protein E4T66_18395 [Sinimarinibacterium sp. CAU 1509]|uniref:hypothetical protein n=1 Tax=Sinimarinibacterium sp. CAU 1509 TaxID=2562283 RepID=UPI0010AC0A34|nr:hypothetical protein [Sinimarinibacterium sp. CAU 1509]TJY57377.1 hypothetical protein E4T66_18395 [Sinimarinibacterium sp. CAU 1509]